MVCFVWLLYYLKYFLTGLLPMFKIQEISNKNCDIWPLEDLATLDHDSSHWDQVVTVPSK